jgi:aminopeptidase-like protein
MHTSRFLNLAKKDLFHLCRSITGSGISKTLKIIKNNFPKLKIYSIKSRTKFFDWRVPDQWDVKKAYVEGKEKKKIIDFSKNNLHLVGYSVPINKNITFKDLLKKIHTIKKLPNAIPYRTSYYKKYWGFCITEKYKQQLMSEYRQNDILKVIIQSKLKKGFLKYGELKIPGKSSQEILISTYICHPSMANNELSGPIVSMSLIHYFMKRKKPDKTLRFIFIPETIGSIVFIKRNLKNLKSNLVGGYNLTCIGDDRMHSCMLTKYKNSLSDLSLLEAYKKLKIKFRVFSFLKRGSDERQYNAPGIDLPVSSIFRSKYEEYPEYHTSLDNFNLVTQKGIEGGFKVAKTAINILLKKKIPKIRFLCEPFMGKRNLYPNLSGQKLNQSTKDIMNFIAYSDGKNDLKKISRLINKSYLTTSKIYKILLKKKIIY